MVEAGLRLWRVVPLDAPSYYVFEVDCPQCGIVYSEGGWAEFMAKGYRRNGIPIPDWPDGEQSPLTEEALQRGLQQLLPEPEPQRHTKRPWWKFRKRRS
jgi:hypothetical protein